MPEEFLATSSLLKRLMDFVGKQPSAVDPSIPGSTGTEYTRHGANPLTRLSDGITLEEALYLLDTPWNVAVSKVQGSSWTNLVLNITRAQPLLIIGKVTRTTSRVVDVTFLDDFTAIGHSDRYGNVTVTGSVAATQSVTMWNSTLSVFDLKEGATTLDTASILQSDSTALLIGTHTPALGARNYSLSNFSGPLGTLVETEIIALGAHAF